MPAGSKPRRSRRPFKKRITLKKVNAKVNKIINQNEMKISQVSISGATTSAGLVDWVSGIDKGTGSEDRIGQQLIGKKLKLRYRMQFASASTHMNEYLRIMVIVQKASLSTKPLPGVILENLTVESFPSLGLAQRYRVLYDRTHVLNRLAELSTDSASRLFTKTINLRDLKIGFNTTTVNVATGAGGSTNQVFLFTLSSAASNPMLLEHSIEIHYKDA